MTTLALPWLGTAVVEVIARLQGDTSLLQVGGPKTCGKSTLLQRLETILRSEGRVPVRISAPLRSPDSGPTAVAQLMDGLRRGGLGGGALAELESKHAWRDQLNFVERTLQDAGPGLVLLLDEPGGWAIEPGSDPYFRDCTEDVLRLVLDRAPGCKIVAGELPYHRYTTSRVELRTQSEPEQWLCDRESWGSLAEAARRLAAEGTGRLENRSPLEIRLLVAHYRLNEILGESWALSKEGCTRRSLSLTLAERLLHGDAICAAVQSAWAFLARVRRPFDQKVLDLAMAPETPQEIRDLVHHGLLFQEEGLWVLHEMLREDALSLRSRLSLQARRGIHCQLGEHYAAASNQRAESLLQDTVEAFHHASESASPSLVEKCRALFVPQLNAAGRSLSLAQRFDEAATLFERALDWDPASDYAHHYLAYNLDCLARAPQEVATHYQRALELRPDHPWWHSRWICFLIARGRTKEARRAWDRALDNLYPVMSSAGTSTRVFEELHRWVATLLLHRGELGFAREVLDGVPTDEPSFRSLRLHLQALAEVAERGAFVPADRMLRPEPWWEAGPFLLPERLFRTHELTHWLAGRVEAIEDGRIELRVARIARAERRLLDILRLDVDEDTLRSWHFEGAGEDLEVGAFVEIGAYRSSGGNVQNRLAVQPRLPWQDLDLPLLQPTPDRYLPILSNAG